MLKISGTHQNCLPWTGVNTKKLTLLPPSFATPTSASTCTSYFLVTHTHKYFISIFQPIWSIVPTKIYQWCNLKMEEKWCTPCELPYLLNNILSHVKWKNLTMFKRRYHAYHKWNKTKSPNVGQWRKFGTPLVNSFDNY
jgi:hypothetical protein